MRLVLRLLCEHCGGHGGFVFPHIYSNDGMRQARNNVLHAYNSGSLVFFCECDQQMTWNGTSHYRKLPPNTVFRNTTLNLIGCAVDRTPVTVITGTDVNYTDCIPDIYNEDLVR